MSVNTLIRKIQTHLQDDAGQTYTKEFILPRISIVNEDLQNEIEDLDLSYDEAVIVLPAVPANTKDLSAYQQDGGMLQDMVSPILIEWRLVGQDDTMWKPVPRVDKVLDRVASASVDSYEWRAGLVYLSPATIAADLRIRCTVLPNVLRGDSDTFIKGMEGIIGWYTAALIYADAGNAEFAQVKKQGGLQALDNLEGILVKQEQNVPRRWGGRRSRVGSLPFGGPIFTTLGGGSTGGTPVGAGFTKYVLTPTPDGVNTVFTSPVALNPQHMLFQDGQMLTLGAANGYNFAGTVVTFAVAPPANSDLELVQ